MRPALPMFFAALLLASLAAAQSTEDCASQYQAERTRIERDAMHQVPPKGDLGAQQRWSKQLHEQLEAAARRGDDCRRGAERRGNPLAASKEQACADSARLQSEALQKRYGSRTLNSAEQSAYRAEETAMLDARQACMLKARRG